MPKPQTIAVAALTFDIQVVGDDAPTSAHLLPPGPFRTVDGRPEECDAWQLDSDIAARVIARLEARKRDVVIDWEHQTLNKEKNGQPAPAAGWFRAAEWRETGLWAINVSWTDRARKSIVGREYRYISTVFFYSKVTGEVIEIFNVALTNTPALDMLAALASLAQRFSVDAENNSTKMGEGNMSAKSGDTDVAVLTQRVKDKETEIATLTQKLGGKQTEVATLTEQNKALQTKVDGFEKAQADAAAEKEKKDHADLLQTALSDGRITPAQKAWAEKQSLAVLTEYLGATAPLQIAQRQTEGRENTGTAALSADEKAMAAKMGVSEELFLQTKRAQEKEKQGAQADD